MGASHLKDEGLRALVAAFDPLERRPSGSFKPPWRCAILDYPALA